MKNSLKVISGLSSTAIINQLPAKVRREEIFKNIDDYITPEILKMAGFEIQCSEEATWRILTTDITNFIEGGINGYCEVCLEDLDKARVRFFHQVQNLYFFITGEN